MREKVKNRLISLVKERTAGNWKDGWVYGKLKQEFDLQPIELEGMVQLLGFKKGWNSVVESLLEAQWQEEQRAEEALNRARQNQDNNKKVSQFFEKQNLGKEFQSENLSEIEVALLMLILEMNVEEQAELLRDVLHRRRL